MGKNLKEEVGVIILVLTNTKEFYKQNEVIELSANIDPMVNTFNGYLRRKMAFSTQNTGFLADVVIDTEQ